MSLLCFFFSVIVVGVVEEQFTLYLQDPNGRFVFPVTICQRGFNKFMEPAFRATPWPLLRFVDLPGHEARKQGLEMRWTIVLGIEVHGQ